MGMKTAREIAKLVQMACILEVCAPKPGNVSRHHDFANTSMIDFLLSAIAIGPAFENVANLPIGAIVYDAIKATQQKAKSNTNLGIVLLLAPLAKACYGASDLNGIRGNLLAILKNLSVEDAQLAYSAIRLAKAGGMGKVSESDVSEEPSITLMQAMNSAQDRDAIAREYATGFAIVFELGLPALTKAVSKGMDYSNAIVQAYLAILSQIPDTLIARKRGDEAAREVSLQAREVLKQGGVFTENGQTAIREMDLKLRDPGHTMNPGTTADLTTAAIFLLLFNCEMSNVLSC
jgi:triphosphoribosyl-dephospho-CoA synthase